jgi:cation diffusion facilitator family transporter
MGITKVMVISFITNAFLSVIKVIFGFIGHSSALIADGVHSFSDLSTDVIAIIGDILSRKPADKKHPYGHGQIEYLTSIFIGLIIIGLGLGIIYSSVDKGILVPSVIVIIVSIFTIISKLVLSNYILKKGYESNNNILIASGHESRADVISSIIVLISILLMNLEDKIFSYSDIVASIIVGLFIIKTGFDVLKENISDIIGEQETDKAFIKRINKIINKFPEIKTIDSLVLLKFGSYYKLIGEVSMDGNMTLVDAHNILEELEYAIKKKENKIKYITIHINPYLN